ncbi:MAG: helix-turn-helix transcriptional regulator [Candidatus Stygibacter frigidus]|nr:helix-turn-helix transcriptional regulator [Candidatus Stygibacter frigidus]
MTQIDKTRIKEARFRKGFTLREAGKNADRSASWISELERSEEPAWRDVRKLATVYKLPMSYFLCEESSRCKKALPEILPQRSNMRLSEAAQKKVLIRLRDNLELTEELEELTGNKWEIEDFPLWQGSEETAEAIRRQICPEEINLDSVVEFLEALKVLVVELESNIESKGEKDASLESMSICSNGRYVIGIDKQIDGVRRRRILCEELGLILAHASGVELDTSQVQSFARYLLLPRRLLKDYYQPGNVTSMSIIDLLCLFFGMERGSILEHLVEVERLHYTGARYWRNKLKRSGNVYISFECSERSSYHRKLLNAAALNHKISYSRTGEIYSLFKY